MTNMKNLIIKKLIEIEKQENVRILYAVESGSRAWGFESVDSDYDVRFIYARPLEWYVSIEEKRDVLEYPLDNLLDISGWDIKKALQLYLKSNPPLYEWLVSPIMYIEHGDFAQKLREQTHSFYSPLSSMHHYLHMAKGNFREYLQKETVRTKKYLYVLRPIFACMWIEKYQTQPPMEFIKLIEEFDIQKSVREEILDLYQQKKNGVELGSGKRIDILNEFLNSQIEHFEKQVSLMPNPQEADGAVLESILREEILK